MIPESMLPGYQNKTVSSSEIVTDYSKFVNVSAISDKGIGEQWKMVLDCVDDAQAFFSTLKTVDALLSTSIVAYNNYLDTNPQNTHSFNFENGNFLITISCDEKNIYYVIDYTADILLLGTQTVQIAMKMDLATGVKNARIQIGDANALVYTIENNKYTFAIKHLESGNEDPDKINLLGKSSYFTIEKKNDGSIEGHAYEYLVASGYEVASVADFYINDKYVTVAGNKASGMVVFDGYICELYSAKTGLFIGYEIMETFTALGNTITYNTLWFNLDSIDGINSIKYVPKTDNADAKVYLNGSSKSLETKKVGGFSSKTGSRRFDIEFRTQYYYEYDAKSDSYVSIAAEVPMLFVQEEFYSTLAKDVAENNNLTITPKVSSADLSKLQSDYASLIDVLIENKSKITHEYVLNYISTKENF